MKETEVKRIYNDINNKFKELERYKKLVEDIENIVNNVDNLSNDFKTPLFDVVFCIANFKAKEDSKNGK